GAVVVANRRRVDAFRNTTSVERELRRPIEHVTNLRPVHEIAAAKDWNSREVREARRDEIVVVARARDARIGVEAGENRIEVLVRPGTGRMIDRIVARVFEPVEPGDRARGRARAVIGLGRAEVARLHAVRIDHELFQHDAGIDAPEVEHMLTGAPQQVLRRGDSDIVGDSLLPGAVLPDTVIARSAATSGYPRKRVLLFLAGRKCRSLAALGMTGEVTPLLGMTGGENVHDLRRVAVERDGVAQ